MPLTAFQREVARILAANRNPESHVAGGAALNRADDSYRYSDDPVAKTRGLPRPSCSTWPTGTPPILNPC